MRASGHSRAAPLGPDSGPPVTCVFNATPVPRDGYAIGVADRGRTASYSIRTMRIRRIGLQPAIAGDRGTPRRPGHPLLAAPESAAARRDVFHRAGVAAADGYLAHSAGFAAPLGRHLDETRRQLRAVSRATQPVSSSACSMPTAAPKSLRYDLPARTRRHLAWVDVAAARGSGNSLCVLRAWPDGTRQAAIASMPPWR